MDALLQTPGWDKAAELIGQTLLDSALAGFYAFTLVLVRMSGLMIVGPVFGQSVVPTNVRVLLILALSILMTPLVQDQTRLGFTRLDANADGRLTREEVPDQLVPRYDRLLSQTQRANDRGLAEHEFYGPPRIPATLIDYALIVAREFVLGFVLGAGVLTILSGLQLAGQIIDQQTGLALGEVFNPGLNVEGSLSSHFLYLLGVIVFLVCGPFSGHLVLVSALLETFQTLPLGDAAISLSTAELMRAIVHQSFVLAIQVAAPILATMSLVALAMGFLGHTVPQINILVIGFAVRALISLLVLAVALSGVGREVVDQVPQVIDQIRFALSGVP